MVPSLIRKPSAMVPLGMSAAALLLIVGYVALFGFAKPAPQQDEGTPARLFQLLMAGQLPIIGYFALKWLPERPGPALRVLALQLAAALIPIATIYILER